MHPVLQLSRQPSCRQPSWPDPPSICFTSYHAHCLKHIIHIDPTSINTHTTSLPLDPSSCSIIMHSSTRDRVAGPALGARHRHFAGHRQLVIRSPIESIGSHPCNSHVVVHVSMVHYDTRVRVDHELLARARRADRRPRAFKFNQPARHVADYCI